MKIVLTPSRVANFGILAKGKLEKINHAYTIQKRAITIPTMYLSDSYQKGKNNNTNQPAMATMLQMVKIS